MWNAGFDGHEGKGSRLSQCIEDVPENASRVCFNLVFEGLTFVGFQQHRVSCRRGRARRPRPAPSAKTPETHISATFM
eukprot:6212983-Pleurochrysis_carterae.AAC.3